MLHKQLTRATRTTRTTLAALLIVVAAAVPSIANADPMPREPLVFVADPKFGVETTVRTSDSLARLVFRYEEALPGIEIDTTNTPGKIIAALGRAVRLLFLDEPLAEVATDITHEVGGHGGRARELGLDPSFQFYLPQIYRAVFSPHDHADVGAQTNYLTHSVVEDTRDIVGTLGGLEAQYTQAWWINERIVRAEGWVHQSDLLLYAESKIPYYDSFFASSLARRNAVDSSNDVSSYVTGLQERSNGFRNEDRRRLAHRLAAGYLWNLIDPTLFYSAWGGVIAPLFKGDRLTQMPLPSIRDLTVFPSPRFSLTPFGSEQILDVFLAPRDGSNRVLDVYGRVGTSGIASYWGGGARLLNVDIFSRLTLGAEIDVWRQPQILLDDRGVYEVPNRFGLNTGLYGDVHINGDVSITGKIAAKTSGYVMAQPIAGGPYGYIGVSLAWR